MWLPLYVVVPCAAVRCAAASRCDGRFTRAKRSVTVMRVTAEIAKGAVAWPRQLKCRSFQLPIGNARANGITGGIIRALLDANRGRSPGLLPNLSNAMVAVTADGAASIVARR